MGRFGAFSLRKHTAVEGTAFRKNNSENNITFACVSFLPTLGLGSVPSVTVGPLSEEGIRRSQMGVGVQV